MGEPLHFEHPTMRATTIFESAADFGLTADEIFETITATLDRLPVETRIGYIDELAGALATRLVEKQRAF
jgi:hypothetical protein